MVASSPVSFAKNRGEQEDQSWIFSSFDPNRIVPGHDPIIWERQPSWIIGGEKNQVAELNLASNEKSRRVK